MVKGRKQKAAGLVGRCLLVGGMIVGAGCDGNLTEGDLFNAAMMGYGMKSGTVEGAQSAAVLGQLGKTAADREHELKAAREGRSEINLYDNFRNKKRRKIKKIINGVEFEFYTLE